MYLIVNNFGEISGVSKTHKKFRNNNFNVMAHQFVEEKSCIECKIDKGVLTIPEGYRRIAENAFVGGHIKVDKIILPTTIEYISEWAFVDLLETTIVVNSNVGHIGLCGFIGCYSVVFNTPITNDIEESAFSMVAEVVGEYSTYKYRELFNEYKELLRTFDFDAYKDFLVPYLPVLKDAKLFKKMLDEDTNYYDKMLTANENFVYAFTALAYIREIHKIAIQMYGEYTCTIVDIPGKVL